MATKKEVVKVDVPITKKMPEKKFVPTPENKSKATRNRLIALVLWLVAIAIEVFAIFQLKQVPINMTIMLVSLVAMGVLAVIGSLLWQKANRLDPASEKDKVKFFIQNQLGAIIAVIAFLPLVILILTNKDLKGKEKGILAAAAVVVFAIAAIVGIDFNPVSAERFAQESALVESLMGENAPVYWTESGTRYHLYQDCQHINTSRTERHYEGTVPQAYELKNIKEMCKTCRKRAEAALADNTE